jgi:ferredoxin/flavodoxin---NADP+ reductase
MACGCGRSPDFCRGWHSLSEEDFKEELKAFEKEQKSEAKEKKEKAKYHEVQVTEVHHYTESLFRIRTTKPNGYTFRPGEFVMIGMGDKVRRAYSFTSAPSDDFLEFYSIKVSDGAFTEKFKYVQPGDTMEVGKVATGTLVEDYLSPNGRRLWLMATGTGIAPFMSLIRQSDIFKSYKQVFVTWTVRKPQDLQAYKSFILNTTSVTLFPTVTQDPTYIGYHGRIQNYLKPSTGSANYLPELNPELDRVMLCGSMEFNNDIKELLETKGFTEGNTNTQGTYLLEKAFVG